MKLLFNGVAYFFILAIATSASAQKNFLPGYVINFEGDTLHGLIDYRNWLSNPKSISFKSGADAASLSYTPIEIAGFYVANDEYRGAVVDVETSSLMTRDLNFDHTFNVRKDTIFLQTIFAGEKSLYHYYGGGKDQFYIRTDNQFELLLYKRYKKETTAGDLAVEKNHYLGQLSYYLSGCPKLQSRLNQALYAKASLIKLFDAYYACRNTGVRFETAEEKTKLKFGIVGGVSFTSATFTSQASFPTLAKGDFSTSVNPTAGLSLEVILPRNLAKWSIHNELAYSAYEVEDAWVNPDHFDDRVVLTTIGWAYIKLNNLVRYRYPSGGDRQIFINAGISNGIGISNVNEQIRETFFGPQEGEAISSTKNYELGWLMGIGGSIRALSLELRYETGNGMSNHVDLSARVNRIHFLFGWRF